MLAEAFDADPFGMLAWRGRGRDDLLAALRRLRAAEPAPPRPVLDVADRPLADRLADFWSPGLPEVRLRSLPAVPATAPDLLLRTFEPPDVLVRGTDLVTLLTPAYRRLAGQDEAETGESGCGTS